MEGRYAQQLTIYFYENWNLTITFSSDVKQGKLLTAGTVTKYSISNIELYYEINNNLFPKADDSGKWNYCLSPIAKKFWPVCWGSVDFRISVYSSMCVYPLTFHMHV